MPQGPIQVADSNLGTRTALNLTAAAVIKASPGRLVNVTIIAPGTTGGAFTFNDCATLAAATAANEIATIPFGATNNFAGSTITINKPCTKGIVLSAVPTTASPVIAVTYT